MNLLTPHHHLTLHIVTPVWPGFYGVSGADQGAWNGRNKSEVRESLLLSSHLLFLSFILPSFPCPLLLSSFCPLIPSFHPLIVPSSYPFHPSLLCPLILSSPRPSPSPVLFSSPHPSVPSSFSPSPLLCPLIPLPVLSCPVLSSSIPRAQIAESDASNLLKDELLASALSKQVLSRSQRNAKYCSGHN